MEKMTSRIIALLTDFGEKDYFVAALKGVILSINQEVEIVDISHEVDSYNRVEAAFILKAAAPYFPPGTIFLAIVDPGVGSNRKIILIKGRRNFFLGPDNGILIPAAEEEGIDEVREIRAEKYFLPSSSRTFEGRDKMAPVAAWLSRGISPEELGEVAVSWEKLVFPKAYLKAFEIRGEIIHVDKFGNLVTNIEASDFLSWFKGKEDLKLIIIWRNKRKKLRYVPTYSSGVFGQLLILEGSSGFLEIALKEASAANSLRLKVGDKITIKCLK